MVCNQHGKDHISYFFEKKSKLRNLFVCAIILYYENVCLKCLLDGFVMSTWIYWICSDGGAIIMRFG